jgi:Zn-dependent peptidase ImmA (M78 family)/DNA-binding XRE family transcriptional regulator
MIYGERIKQAREINGLTQIELASIIGCKQAAIAQFENNVSLPSEDTLKLIGKATGFLVSFFETKPISNFSLGSLSYRSRRSLTKKDESQAYQFAVTIYEQVKKMSQKLNLPALRLPKVAEKPELSAKVTRAALGLPPDKPISNLINNFEQNGGVLFVTPFFLPKIDAFSRWAEFDIDRPMVVTNAGVPGDRLRFSVSHELGHLVMHNSPHGKVVELEKEADAFASAFLMPRESIKCEFVAPFTLTSIAKMKPRWGVSIQALIRRAYDLDLISERHYHYLFEQLSIKGWRRVEPHALDIRIESPQAFRKMLDVLYTNQNDFALDMNLEPKKAQEIAAFN